MLWNMPSWRTAHLTKFSAISLSGCQDDIQLAPVLLCFHILPQYCINCRLVASPLFAKELQHVGIETQRDLLFRARPDNGIRKEVGTEFCDIGKIDVFVL